MRAPLLSAVAAAVITLCAAGPAGAQGPRGRAVENTGTPADTCAQLRSLPNPPMSYEQCLQMMQAQQQMQAATTDSSAARPGDEAMTCEQIKAEFVANGGLNVNKQEITNGQAAAQDFQAKNAEIQAEAKAMAAKETVTDAAAAAAAYTPLGGAAAAAAQAQSVADQTALNARAKQELLPAQQRLTSAAVAETSDIAAQIQANPRQARLIGLAERKNCH